MDEFTVCGLYDLSRTRAAAIFENVKYPWAILGCLEAFTAAIGRALPRDEFEEREAGVFVARDAVIADSAVLCAPSIVDHETELRPGAYLRGGVIIGKNAVIGNSCEIKNALLFDGAQVPHFNYVGDSVLGHYAHLGAGAVTSNFKSDGSCITIHAGDICFDTARKKVGSFLGDFAEIGCGAVLCPGTIVGRGATVYPQSMVRGYVPPNHIYKDACRVVRKQAR